MNSAACLACSVGFKSTAIFLSVNSSRCNRHWAAKGGLCVRAGEDVAQKKFLPMP